MSRTGILVLVTVLAAAPLAAQGRINARLAQAQPPKFTPALCNLSMSNSKVEKGRNALRKAHDAKTPADRAAQLSEAKSSISTAMLNEGQGNSAAAWYYLARIALMEGDAAAADSAFTKALELSPSCELDINQYRQNSWAVLGQAGVELMRQDQKDSALVQFRDASLLFRGMPHVYTNLGLLFANNNQEDSAAVYFAKSLEIAENDTTLVEDRNAVALNLAIIYQRLNKNAEAVGVLRKYLSWKPDDTDAQKYLAIAFRGAGMTDSAEALENAMVERFSKQNLDSLDIQDLMSVGVVAFNKNRYDDAANAFGKAAQRSPYAREPRFNLANAWLAKATQVRDSIESLRKAAKATRTPTDAQKAAFADTVKLESEARTAITNLITESGKLVESEPMNEDALRLLAQGHRMLGQQDQLLKTAERLVGMPFKLEVTEFQVSKTGVRFTADAVGREPQDATGKPIKPAAMTIVFEFLDASGAVVATKEALVPALAKDAKHPIQLEAQGAGVAGWRYRAKAG